MNGFFLLLPFLAVRFGLLGSLNKNAVSRAAYFAPLQGKEKIAYSIYQVSNIGLFLSLIFLKAAADFSILFYMGLLCYFGGLLLCAAVIVSFSAPDDSGMNANGIYQFSRNPMYIAYFICFLGMAFLTQSLVLFVILLIFQISAHWIILSEERWCTEKFGEAYKKYMRTVRRYL